MDSLFFAANRMFIHRKFAVNSVDNYRKRIYNIVMYIYQYPQWPDFTYDSEVITPLLEQCHILQGKLLAKMELIGFSERDEQVLSAISSGVIKSSEIEGQILNAEQVRSSVARRLGIQTETKTVADRIIDAVVEMTLDATDNYRRELTIERLFGWHACLFPTGYSGMYKIETGKFRSSPMQVVSGAIGMEKVHYEAPEPDKVNDMMKEFLEWFKDPPGDSFLNAAIAHLWFVTIHPFDDGNGRIGRAISEMMLSRSDQSRHRFYTMSSQILLDRNNYYDVLEKTQHGSTDITEWLKWFLNCLEKSITESDTQIELTLKKYRFLKKIEGIPLNSRQSLVINRLLDPSWFGVLNTSKWGKIANCSTDSALRDINDLVAKGILSKEPTSGGRSTNYFLVH